MSEAGTEHFSGFGAAQLALHRLGQGKPVILLHGLFSSAEMNWIRFGHAQQLAAAGFEALMPDLRAHGDSAKPHAAGAYPPDVLVRDVESLVEHLGVADYDLVGFSLGARTSVRAVLAGLTPRRLVMGGMGLQGLAGWERRADFFLEVIDGYGGFRPGDPHYMAQQFMKSMKVDREAARLLLATMQDTPPAALAAVTMPTLVVCGSEDDDNGDPNALAAALPDAVRATVPGTHMGSVTHADLGREIVSFLTKAG